MGQKHQETQRDLFLFSGHNFRRWKKNELSMMEKRLLITSWLTEALEQLYEEKWAIVEKCWDALDKVRFQKRIADEMVCEHECETDISTEDYDEELEKLHRALQLKRDEQDAAEAAYAAALASANESWAKFRLLMSQV